MSAYVFKHDTLGIVHVLIWNGPQPPADSHLARLTEHFGATEVEETGYDVADGWEDLTYMYEDLQEGTPQEEEDPAVTDEYDDDEPTPTRCWVTLRFAVEVEGPVDEESVQEAIGATLDSCGVRELSPTWGVEGTDPTDTERERRALDALQLVVASEDAFGRYLPDTVRDALQSALKEASQ